jgi:hypothetical protein
MSGDDTWTTVEEITASTIVAVPQGFSCPGEPES